MEYPWQTVVVAVFALMGGMFILVSIFHCFCVYCRPNRCCPDNTGRYPKSIQQALTKLEAVTEKRARRNSQTESDEAECPICLGHLYPSDARTSTTVAADDVDLEAGNRVLEKDTTTSEAAAVESKDQPLQPINDDVLKIQKCSHLFHARCLATWYLGKNFTCPVCRTPYFDEVVKENVPIEGYPATPAMPIVAF